MESADDFIDDATLWAPLPCKLCPSNDVAFCLDVGNQAIGACQDHLVPVLKHFVLEQHREVLVMRNCPVGPLQAVDRRSEASPN